MLQITARKRLITVTDGNVLTALTAPQILMTSDTAPDRHRIDSLSDLKYFLRADRISLGHRTVSFTGILLDPIWRFQILLRVVEFLTNCCPRPAGRLLRVVCWWHLNALRIRLGFTIPLNVFGPGLSIAHYGPIVINSGARIGANCRIHPGVCVGGLDGKAPTIGDNVYLAPGAKLFGGISIGDDVAIGANAVVGRDIASSSTAVGVPARIVSTKGAKRLILCGSVLALEPHVDWTQLGPAEVLASSEK